MQTIAFVSVLIVLAIVYLAIGFALTLTSIAVWEGEWMTVPRRILAASFFPFAYFLDGKTEPKLTYPIFGRHAKSAYVVVSILTWPRVAATIGIAVFLGFCKVYWGMIGPIAATSKEDDD